MDPDLAIHLHDVRCAGVLEESQAHNDGADVLLLLCACVQVSVLAAGCIEENTKLVLHHAMMWNVVSRVGVDLLPRDCLKVPELLLLVHEAVVLRS